MNEYQIKLAENNTPTVEEFESLDLTTIGLTKDDYEKVVEVKKELAVINNTSVSEYGKNITVKTASYTEQLLDLVKNKDLDDTGKKLNQVVTLAQQLNAKSLLNEDHKGIVGFFMSKIKGAKQSLDQRINSTKEQMDVLINEIEINQNNLKQQDEQLENMSLSVKTEYKTIGIYIAAGELSLKHIRERVSQLSAQEQTQNIVQEIYDLNLAANSLEKRIYDLGLLQQLSFQTLPMIGVILNNNTKLIEKFYNIKNITLPAWKNHITMAINAKIQEKSVAMVDNIDNVTDVLLRKNVDDVRDNSIKIAKANQRSSINIETLEYMNKTLFETIQEVNEVEKAGMAERDKNTIQLKQMQASINNIMLEKKD